MTSAATICGTKARLTIQTSDVIMENHSTLGGMIVIGYCLFGLKLAVGVVNYFLRRPISTSTNEIESTDNCSSDSDFS